MYRTVSDGITKIGRGRREKSRKRLLEHLKTVCQGSDVYKPANLTILGSEISKYVAEKEQLKREEKRSELEESFVGDKKEQVGHFVSDTSSVDISNSGELDENGSQVSSIQLGDATASNSGEREKFKFRKLKGVGKEIKKVVVTVGSGIKEHSVNKIRNEFLNGKITDVILEHIGEIDIRLKKDIEEELKRLENKQKEDKEQNPADWGKLAVGHAYRLIDNENLRRIKIELDKQEKKVEKEFNDLIRFYLSKGKLDNFLYHLPDFFLESRKDIVEVMRNALKNKDGLSQGEAESLLGKKLRIFQVKINDAN